MMWLSLVALAGAEPTDVPTGSPPPAQQPAPLDAVNLDVPVASQRRSRTLLAGSALTAVLGAVALGVAADARAEYLAGPRGTEARTRPTSALATPASRSPARAAV